MARLQTANATGEGVVRESRRGNRCVPAARVLSDRVEQRVERLHELCGTGGPVDLAGDFAQQVAQPLASAWPDGEIDIHLIQLKDRPRSVSSSGPSTMLSVPHAVAPVG